MMKLTNALFICLTICICTNVFAQQENQYVLLRPETKSEVPDTIYGRVNIPDNGVFWNVKITTSSGEMKFKTKEVLGIKVQNLYFASIPYGKSYAIVPRIVTGKLDLYYYYTGSDRLKYIDADNVDQLGYTGIIAVDLSQIIWSKTSNFYLDNHMTEEFYKVPHANTEFKEQTAELFSDNPEVYNKIKSGTLGAKDMIEIVRLYNN